MNVYEESGLKFDFSGSINSRKADELSYNGLSAADFIVETYDEYLFIEVKNPDNKKARSENRTQFLEEMKQKEFPLKMAMKFKDSLLKELAMSSTFNKPIIYILIIEYNGFDARQRSRLYESINGRIPKFGEKIYRAIDSIKFKLHTKEEFTKSYMFDITGL